MLSEDGRDGDFGLPAPPLDSSAKGDAEWRRLGCGSCEKPRFRSDIESMPFESADGSATCGMVTRVGSAVCGVRIGTGFSADRCSNRVGGVAVVSLSMASCFAASSSLAGALRCSHRAGGVAVLSLSIASCFAASSSLVGTFRCGIHFDDNTNGLLVVLRLDRSLQFDALCPSCLRFGRPSQPELSLEISLVIGRLRIPQFIAAWSAGVRLCVDMCIDMCIDMRGRPVCRHVHRHLYRHAWKGGVPPERGC